MSTIKPLSSGAVIYKARIPEFEAEISLILDSIKEVLPYKVLFIFVNDALYASTTLTESVYVVLSELVSMSTIFNWYDVSWTFAIVGVKVIVLYRES